MIWNEAMETMPRPEIEKLQSERLQQLVGRVYQRVPFYKQQFDEAGLKPDDIGSVKDLPRLPFTRKVDLRDNYPFGLFAVPMDFGQGHLAEFCTVVDRRHEAGEEHLGGMCDLAEPAEDHHPPLHDLEPQLFDEPSFSALSAEGVVNTQPPH